MKLGLPLYSSNVLYLDELDTSPIGRCLFLSFLDICVRKCPVAQIRFSRGQVCRREEPRGRLGALPESTSPSSRLSHHQLRRKCRRHLTTNDTMTSTTTPTETTTTTMTEMTGKFNITIMMSNLRFVLQRRSIL